MTAAAPETPETPEAAALLPERLTLALAREFETRYGENPHQPAAVYRLAGGPGLLGGMRQIQGKELSWNNLLDADAARKLVALFDDPAVVIVKHNNPCGVGRGAGPRHRLLPGPRVRPGLRLRLDRGAEPPAHRRRWRRRSATSSSRS